MDNQEKMEHLTELFLQVWKFNPEWTFARLVSEMMQNVGCFDLSLMEDESFKKALEWAIEDNERWTEYALDGD